MARPALSNVSIAALKAEIDRRMKKLDSLKAQRDALDRQIAELEGAAGQAIRKPRRKSGPKPGRKPRAKRATDKPLAEHVRDALAKATRGMGVRQLEKAVLAAGYPTKAKDLYVPIMKALPKAGAKRVAPGVYSLAGGKAATKAGKRAKKAGRKAEKKLAAPAAKASAPAKRKRKTFAQTADQMVLGLLEGGKTLTTAEVNAAWTKAGRAGKADKTLSQLCKVGKLKRENIEGAKGSRYSAV